MKKVSILRVLGVLIFVISGAVNPLSAQEITVDAGYVTLRNSTGTAYLSNGGIFQVHQTSANAWARACEARVHHYRAICFQALDGNWNNVFRVYGDGLVEQNGITIHSDSTLKEEITDLGSQIDKLKKINSVKYKLKADEKHDGKEKKTHFGFLAQDLEKIYPDMVFTNEEGMKSIFYTELIPVLLEAVKEQQAEIERQAALISELDKRLEKLEKKSK